MEILNFAFLYEQNRAAYTCICIVICAKIYNKLDASRAR